MDLSLEVCEHSWTLLVFCKACNIATPVQVSETRIEDDGVLFLLSRSFA